MQCPKCGAQNEEQAVNCAQCGAVLKEVKPAAAAAPTEKIPNYLVQSILVTVFCCLPLGIPAIVFAAQVNSKLQAGDIEGAREYSKKAKLWSWLAFGIGLAFLIIYWIFIILMSAMGTMDQY